MSATEHGFKAEVQQLLDLMIHSVYSEREVFLRELVSNAADALDKARFLSLTRQDLTPTQGDPGIRITVTTDALTIEDDGIGLTEKEAVENLGTIARSGSKEFVTRMREAGKDAPKLIGQFGVGFYACFMVAKRVEVVSRSALPGEAAVRWVSEGAGRFETSPAEKAHRGTRITLTFRDDATEFADAATLKEIIRRHSNFLPWIIRVEGEQANSGKALWAEPPSQVTEEEASSFYRNIAGDWRDPALKIHASVDSPVQYHALLFVPEERPHDLFNPRAERGPRLYARRVLIAEHAQELLPEWLRFVKGVVDSEDIPLNVSREMVQKTPTVRKIRDALVKRILKDLQKCADAEPEVEVIEAGADKASPAANKAGDYGKIWKEFGPLLKEGAYAAPEWRELLLSLLRFNLVSHVDEEPIASLAGYKAAMKDGQDTIWYIAAETRAAALVSPHLEAFKKRGWDVIVATDAVDEFLFQALEKFDGVKIQSVTRGDLDLKDDDTSEKADLSGFVPYLTDLFSGAVKKVRESARLTDSAAVLVDDDSGVSANMARIFRQANQPVPAAARVLEVNPRHPLIKSLGELHARGKTAEVEPLARLLLDDAMLLEGNVKEPAAMGRRLQDLLERAAKSALNG